MLLCAQYILPVTSEPIVDGAVLVRDGVIRDIGSADMLRLRYPDEEVVDQGLAAIMPGLVDLHTRLEQSVLRGVVNDAPYVEWLSEVARKSARLEAVDWFDSAILGGLDALSSGITTVADITTTGASCTAVNKLGLRSVIYRSVAAMDRDRINAAMQLAQKDILHWREEVDSDRVTIGIAPAPLFTNHPATLTAVSQFATKENLPVAMWLAGSREECDFVRYGSSPFQVHGGDVKRGYVEIPPWLPTGVSPVRYALNWSAFDAPNVMIVGAVCVDDADLKKLREYNVAVCVCPRACAQLGMGIAPLDEFRDALRDALAARREHRLPRRAHHARGGHYRRCPRSRPPGQGGLAGDRQVRRPHRRGPVQLAPVLHHRPGGRCREHLHYGRRAHDHGGRRRAL